MTHTTPSDPFADCQPTARDGGDVHSQRMLESITEMSETPGSGIAMCHRQGKSAVYLSDDEPSIIEHPPHGPITRTPLTDADTHER